MVIRDQGRGGRQVEALGQAEGGLFCPICMTDGAARLLRMHGTKELQERFIPKLASTDLATLMTGAMFLTEKDGGRPAFAEFMPVRVCRVGSSSLAMPRKEVADVGFELL